MSSTKPRILLRLAYEEAAQEYLRSLPLEHFMEATPQATQRKITLESLDLVHARRPDVQVFNELLVQYPRPRTDHLGQVVPDNMIVLHPEPIEAEGSFDVLFQPAAPFCMLEYVSKNSKRKDYDDNMRKYERELKVPYYLLFYPDAHELTLYHHNKRKYVSVKPNAQEHLAIAEIELEVALLDGWVRYWYQGTLLPLPADLQGALDEAQQRLVAMQNQLDATQSRLDATQSQLDATQSQLEQERQARLTLEEETARLRSQSAPTRRPRRTSS
jgi:Uma2 family endonuclease